MKYVYKIITIMLICGLMLTTLKATGLISSNDVVDTEEETIIYNKVVIPLDDSNIIYHGDSFEATTYNVSINTYSEYEIYELAKIIMCEAEGESQECKEYVGWVVLNRVESDKFPDNIHDVIFQKNQFTPIFDGRWEMVEPNKDCYNAAYTVINTCEQLTDALYFESCKGDSWHSRNLTKVAEIDNIRFYVD